MEKRFSPEESGQSMVETAIILPLLILLLMAILEFGWVIFNQVSFENMAHMTVHANSKTDSANAEQFFQEYIQENYERYGKNNLQVVVNTEIKNYYYNEYVWKPNQKKHWMVPMYFEVLRTKMEISCDVPYLTAFGRGFFPGGGDKMHLKAKSVAVRVLGNDSTTTF